MTRRLELLQWFGFSGAALAWAAQLVSGFWVTHALCNPSPIGSATSNDASQLGLMVAALAVAFAAQAAAAVVFLRTSPSDDDYPPPNGRLHFLAAAALVANVLFIVGIVLSGVASSAGDFCRQA
jgi:hypothetical protein